ncbi:MAG: SDR family oxidoreductase [Clostridiales bacterium]|nr:SDR family oxidoreductase [Clostridiales bacterium]
MEKVLITGGSVGIGAALVTAFAAGGYEVRFTYNRHQEQAEKLAAQTGAVPFYCELEDAASIDCVLNQAGAADILINNAGVAWTGLVTDMDKASYRHLMAVNLDACFYICQQMLPAMIRQKKGKIINVSSIWGVVGASCECAYSASKGGMIAFTKALAKEVGPSGVAVNCICPGVIETDMIASLRIEDKKALAEATPLMRLGKPEEIAQAALFLAQSTFITGQVLCVDGGFSL